MKLINYHHWTHNKNFGKNCFNLENQCKIFNPNKLYVKQCLNFALRNETKYGGIKKRKNRIKKVFKNI